MRRSSVWAILVALCLGVSSAVAQDTSPGGVSLIVQAGYETYFRDSEWLPVNVRLRNDGDAVSGRLVIRPETTNGVLNTASTPVTLPGGARQTVTLDITARALANQIRVELLGEDDRVIAQQTAPLRAIGSTDPLYVVITESPSGSIDLTGTGGGANVFQANLQITDLPDRIAVLDPVDVITFSDVDTGSLSAGQIAALTDWVASGGHLIVTGGVNWQATAAGLGDLLPLTPDDASTLDGLPALANWLRINAPLTAETVASVGTLRSDARVLASEDANGSTIPLLTRRIYGDGTVDYLAVDPNTAPLRGWSRIADLWTAVLTTVEPLPSWGGGFSAWEPAAVGTEILPGFDPLPDVLPLFGFLALYIVLVGPINYFVLARLNRREWAWVTIPALIIIFSTLAYTLGSNLRGNDVTLSRLTVVRSWQDVPNARVDALLGLLSPKRASYSFGVDEADFSEATFRPIPRPPTASTLLTRTSQVSVNVVQTNAFEATDFNVDASFVAGFNATGAIPKPNIGGSATFTYDAVAGQQTARGSVRNDTDMVLTDAVILARGVTYRLEQPLTPGDLVDFEVTLPGEGTPAAARRSIASTSTLLSARLINNSTKQTVVDIIGTDAYDPNITRRLLRDLDTDAQEERRRQWLLTAMVNDFFDATGRGDRIYLAAWSSSVPLETKLGGANWHANDRSLYLVELENSVPKPTGEIVISSDRFVWSALESQTIGEVTPIGLTMQPGESAALRFTPLPDAVLSSVSQLIVDIGNVNIASRNFPMQLWNWRAQTWDDVDVVNDNATIFDPQEYLGPENAVQMRFVADDIAGYLRIGRISVSMVGIM